ncbi:MAG: ATP phosphoribosyltransferase [Sulfobacillus sp.]
MSMLTIAIAKGRILDSMRPLWEAAMNVWPIPDSTRQLWFPPSAKTPGVLIARARDIPTMVSLGVADLGVVGLDVLREYPQPDILEVADLKISQCRIVMAGSHDSWPEGPVRIATKYPRIARQFLEQHQISGELVALSGSLELAPVLGLAPYIVDIVDTGQTLSEHDLHEIFTIMASSARLIANPAHWYTKAEAQEFRDVMVCQREEVGNVQR